MKKYLLVLVALIALISCNSGNKSSKELSAEPIVMELGIDGMTCNGCVATVEASVKQMGEGITSVKANLDSSNAVVEFIPGKIKEEDIKKAIELNGYKVTKIEKK